MAPLLASSMAAKVISDFTPPGLPGSATLVPETELLPRVELDVGPVSTPYDTRSGGNQRGRAGARR
jgi:hypothetical protein